MLAMVAFGGGELIGSFFIGFIVDRFGSKVAAVCNLVTMVTMTGVTIAFILTYNFGWLAYIMCFLWGF